MTRRDDGKRMLTYEVASKRLGRSVRTLKRWQREGMPTALDARGRRLVRQDVAEKWKREKLGNWPPHQYRLRRLLAEDGGEEEAD